MRTGHVIGIDFQFRFGQKLTVLIQQERLTDLIAIRFLCAGFDEDLALKHARCPVAQDFLEHLPAFAALRIMGDEHRVVLMEIPITHSGPRHMRHRVITHQFDHTFIACHHAVGGQGKGFEEALRPQPGKNMRGRLSLVIAALGTDMMKPCAFGHIHLHHLVEPCSGGAILEKGNFGLGVKLDHMMQDRIRNL